MENVENSYGARKDQLSSACAPHSKALTRKPIEESGKGYRNITKHKNIENSIDI